MHMALQAWLPHKWLCAKRHAWFHVHRLHVYVCVHACVPACVYVHKYKYGIFTCYAQMYMTVYRFLHAWTRERVCTRKRAPVRNEAKFPMEPKELGNCLLGKQRFLSDHPGRGDSSSILTSPQGLEMTQQRWEEMHHLEEGLEFPQRISLS